VVISVCGLSAVLVGGSLEVLRSRLSGRLSRLQGHVISVEAEGYQEKLEIVSHAVLDRMILTKHITSAMT
jgi:hypothetical protein